MAGETGFSSAFEDMLFGIKSRTAALRKVKLDLRTDNEGALVALASICSFIGSNANQVE